MSGYTFTSDLLEDLLFRAGEATDGTSDFAAAGLRYLNRAYMALALGGAEFEPTIQEDWWWLHKSPPGVLTLDPPYATGTVAVVEGSATITFSVAPVAAKLNWFLAVDAQQDTFRVIGHNAGSTTATLDSPYTGPTATGLAYWLLHLEYDVAPDVLRLLSVRSDRAPSLLAPDGAELIDENTIRFNTFGALDDTSDAIRVEYEYLFRPPLLTNATLEEPVVPLQWRRLLVDGALFFLYMDKNDNRTDGIGLLLIKGLKAMQRENHHKSATQNGRLGQLYPRQADLGGWPDWEFQVIRP